MNILMLNYEYPPLGGGGGVAAEKLAEGWISEGHSVDVITTQFDSLEAYEERNGVRIHRVKVWKRKDLNTATLPSLLSFPSKAKKKLKELFSVKSYDVINTHFAIPTGPLGVWASEKYGVPNVLSLHGGDIYDPTKSLSPHRIFFLRNYVKKILNKSNVLVAQSQNTRNNTNNIYQPKHDIKVIPLGFQAPDIPQVERKVLNLDKENYYLVSIGRMVKRKGFEYLVEAMAELPEAVKLILIGDGPMREELENQARNLRITERIIFTGRAEDKEKFAYLAAADAYVLSSIHEGYGIVLQEAMEAGLPIVSTNYGGQTDFLHQRENALLVNPSSAVELKDAINELYSQPDLAKKMAKKNKEDIKQYYIENVAKQYSDLFQSLLV